MLCSPATVAGSMSNKDEMLGLFAIISPRPEISFPITWNIRVIGLSITATREFNIFVMKL